MSTNLPKNSQWLKIPIQFNLKTFTFPLVSRQIKKIQGLMCYSPRNLVTPLSSLSSLLPSRILWRASNEKIGSVENPKKQQQQSSNKEESVDDIIFYFIYVKQFIKLFILSIPLLKWSYQTRWVGKRGRGGKKKRKKYKENQKEIFVISSHRSKCTWIFSQNSSHVCCECARAYLCMLSPT